MMNVAAKATANKYLLMDNNSGLSPLGQVSIQGQGIQKDNVKGGVLNGEEEYNKEFTTTKGLAMKDDSGIAPRTNPGHVDSSQEVSPIPGLFQIYPHNPLGFR